MFPQRILLSESQKAKYLWRGLFLAAYYYFQGYNYSGIPVEDGTYGRPEYGEIPRSPKEIL